MIFFLKKLMLHSFSFWWEKSNSSVCTSPLNYVYTFEKQPFSYTISLNKSIFAHYTKLCRSHGKTVQETCSFSQPIPKNVNMHIDSQFILLSLGACFIKTQYKPEELVVGREWSLMNHTCRSF